MKSSTTTFIFLCFSFFSSSLLSQSWEASLGVGAAGNKDESSPVEMTTNGINRINDTLGVNFCQTMRYEEGAFYTSRPHAFIGLMRNFKPSEKNIRLQAGLKINYSSIAYDFDIRNFETIKFETFDTIAMGPPVNPSGCDTITSVFFPGTNFVDSYESLNISLDFGVGKGFHNNRVWFNVGGNFQYSVWYKGTMHFNEVVVDNFSSTEDFVVCRSVMSVIDTQEGIEPVNFLGYFNMQLYPIPRLGFEVGFNKHVRSIFSSEMEFAARPTYSYVAVNYKFGQ